MKILKPKDIGTFYRFMKLGKKYGVFSAYLSFDLLTGKKLKYNEVLEKVSKFTKVIDEGYFKINAEYMVYGNAYAYDNATKAVMVSVKIGNLEKELVVFGDRQWCMGIPCEPDTFDYREIKYYDVSPPFIEYPDKLVTSKSDKYIPASFSAIPLEKRKLRGDFKDYKKYWPYFPDDFDVSFFNMAALDQQQEKFFTEEEITICNMHPKYPVINSKIPSLNVRCFMQKDESFYEIALRKDTLLLFPEILTGIVVFRGVIEVKDPTFSEIKYLFFETEREKKDEKYYYDLFIEKTATKKRTFKIEKEKIKLTEIKYAKKIKTLIKQSLGEAPSLNKTPFEVNAAGASKFAKTQMKINNLKNHIMKFQHYIFNNFEDLIDEQLFAYNNFKDWKEDGFDFVNLCAKRLIRMKKYSEEFVEMSLVGFNDREMNTVWGDKEVFLPKGIVLPRFKGTELKAVRIINNEKTLLVNGSDEKFPLVIIENEKYPFFVTDTDLEGWMVNYECYDMCNVLVCNDKDTVEEIVKDNEIFVWKDNKFDINAKIIENDDTLENCFQQGDLREVFKKYMRPDPDYEENLGFEEAEEKVKSKINAKMKEFEEVKEKVEKSVQPYGKKDKVEFEHDEINVDHISQLGDFLKDILKDENIFSDETLNAMTDSGSFKKIEELKKELDEKMKKINEAEEKLKNIKVPDKKKKVKFKYTEIETAKNAIFGINCKNKVFQNKKIELSIIKGSFEECEFENCEFKNTVFDAEINNCKFLNCVFENCTFKKNIKAVFDSKIKTSVFEKINVESKFTGCEKTLFTECSINKSEFTKTEFCNFIKVKMNDVFFKFGKKNAFNKSYVEKAEFDTLENLTFIGCEVKKSTFKGIMEKMRVMKETLITECDFTKLKMDRSTFFESKIYTSKFIKALINLSVLNKSEFKNCDFRKAEFKKSRLEFSLFENSLFGGCNFYRASFRGSLFKNTSLIWTNLYGVEMFDVKFNNVLLDNANIEKTYLKKEYFENE